MTQEEIPEVTGKLAEYLSAINATPFGTLFGFLTAESPLRASLIIACLKLEEAAFILEFMPEDIRQPIIEVLARGIRVSPDVLECIAGDTVEKLQQLQVDDMQRLSVSLTADRDEFEDLLPHLNRRTVKFIFHFIKEMDVGLYEEMCSSIVTFEDFMLLDDRCVQRVLKEVRLEELAAALLTAPEPLKEKLKRNMSKRNAARLEEAMKAQDWLLSVTDPEKIQDRIAGIIARLAKTEEIIIPRNGAVVV